MKKSFSLLTLALLVAGCAGGTHVANTPSPWSNSSGPGNEANPLVQVITLERDPDKPAVLPEHKPFSWETNKAVAVDPVTGAPAPTAPEDPMKIRVLGVAPDYAMFSFLRAEKAELNQVFIIANDKKDAARVRVIRLGADNEIVAEVLPNQQQVPMLIVGDLLSCFVQDASDMPGAPAKAAAEAPAPSTEAPPAPPADPAAV